LIGSHSGFPPGGHPLRITADKKYITSAHLWLESSAAVASASAADPRLSDPGSRRSAFSPRRSHSRQSRAVLNRDRSHSGNRMPASGQSLHFDGRPVTSDFTSTSDMSLHHANRRDGPEAD